MRDMRCLLKELESPMVGCPVLFFLNDALEQSCHSSITTLDIKQRASMIQRGVQALPTQKGYAELLSCFPREHYQTGASVGEPSRSIVHMVASTK